MITLVKTVSLVLNNLSYGIVSSYIFLNKDVNSRSLNITVKTLRNFWLLDGVQSGVSSYRLFPCANSPEKPEGLSGLPGKPDANEYHLESNIEAW